MEQVSHLKVRPLEKDRIIREVENTETVGACSGTEPTPLCAAACSLGKHFKEEFAVYITGGRPATRCRITRVTRLGSY
jgi:predicted Rossmann-fold nucleotide-binding protein